jgi:hypothetical protein
LLLPGHANVVRIYDEYIFRPYQSFRNITIGAVPISVGDLLYLAGGIAILLTLARWVYFLVRIKTHGQYFGHSLVRCMITWGILYVLFFIGWGGNYYKPSLTHYWHLEHATTLKESALVSFDSFLVDKINTYATNYREHSFKEADKKSQNYYKAFTDSRTRLHGLNAKASLFGYFMQYLGIQGYYNPFTGEAQVNRFLPSFMLPFVICHEMAHQSGVAAEDDANLLSYAVCTAVPDSSFRYSAYFNIWLYTNSRIRAYDSTLANSFRERLNPLSQGHLDTLRAIRRRYRSEISEYSGQLYDGYLRLHNQKDGIHSYNNVALTAWALEQRRPFAKDWLIRIP